MRISSYALPRRATHFSDCTALVCRSWPTLWPRCAAAGLLKTRNQFGGKKWTPALTLPQIRQGIAVILREAYQCDTMSYLLDACQKRLRRNELARFYPWKQRNRLPPLNLHKRQF